MVVSGLILVYTVGTIITGSFNSILTKYQDLQCVDHCDDPQTAILFNQPVLQTFQMFIGEILCWLPIIYANLQKRNQSNIRLTNNEVNDNNGKREITSFKDSLLLALPSSCDLLGTTLMNVGMLYTPVSIYQMTRGSIILIVGLLSVIFLKRRITKLEWVSLFVVFTGVFLVGLGGFLQDQGNQIGDDLSLDIVIGMALIFLGITLSASQFVIEEHILLHLNIEPMRLVGYEGIYGSLLTFISMILGHLFYGKGPFDMIEGFKQMVENPSVLWTSFAIMICISSFNFFGISLTFKLNATARSTIDTCRTLMVWLISLMIGWEQFHFLQLFAFSLLVLGTFAFNGVIQPENWDVIPEWLKDLEIHEHT